ncbi:MAG: FtsX-like permease family protein [Candidatus Electrothrix sp. ATG2]|nr:FtsX-like permease family protein [Candidatus Electrothrix sp. ATG2]
MAMDLPLAWLQLRAQKPQTLVAIASLTFITVFLFMQVGSSSAFINALLEMPRKLKGDLFLLNASTVTALRPVPFSQRRLYQALSLAEVDSVTPLYMQGTQIPDPSGKPGYLTRVLVIGFSITTNPFHIQEIDDKLCKLGERGVLLIDERSKSDFGPIIQEVIKLERSNISLRSGLGQTKLSLKGVFPLGMNEVNYSHLLTSDATFMDIFRAKRKNINIGVIHLKPGADPGQAKKLLGNYLPSDVVVMQKHEMLAKEKELFEFKTPVGIFLRIAILVSIVGGIVVVYQILYQMTSKYLREYSTLKAIGFSHRMLISIVLVQAMTLTVTGYALGLTISFYLYDWMSELISIPYRIEMSKAVAVFALVTFISQVSALLAIRKLRELDPAELFG